MNLVSETHSFDVHLAAKYGIEEAILLKHFAYWVGVNQRLKRNFIDGRTWTYMTIEEIQASFPYWSLNQISDLLTRLCIGKSRRSKKNELDFEPVLLKGNFNKSPYDRTLWYAFVEEPSRILANAKMEKSECQNEIGRMPQSYKDTDTKPDAKTDKKEKAQAPCSPELALLAASFFEKLKTLNPKIKPPDLKKWEKDFELLIKDGNTIEEITNVINYVVSTANAPASNGFCWATKILNPKKLREKFATLWGEMKIQQSISTQNQKRNSNYVATDAEIFRMRKMAEFVEEKLPPHPGGRVHFTAGHDSALLVHEGKGIKKVYEFFRLSPMEFKKLLTQDLPTVFPQARGLFFGEE